jgi:hypothetical protein
MHWRAWVGVLGREWQETVILGGWRRFSSKRCFDIAAYRVVDALKSAVAETAKDPGCIRTTRVSA